MDYVIISSVIWGVVEFAIVYDKDVYDFSHEDFQ